MEKTRGWFLVIGILLILGLGAYGMVTTVKTIAERTLQPVNQTSDSIATQVARVLQPIPTVLPDPIVIIHDIRTLARLETVQYTVERVITAETGPGFLKDLFGDKLLFIAHGVVIAGLDLQKLGPRDIWAEDGVLYMRLPEAEVFTAALDNEKSYVYDRETGLLTKGDVHLETTARQAAERAIKEATLEDGILQQARRNGEAYFSILLRNLGYPEVIFVTD